MAQVQHIFRKDVRHLWPWALVVLLLMATQWFNTSVFSLPALYTFGNAPRNVVIGPGLQEFDLSLQKDVQLTEVAKLQFRAEAYNLFNHPNFNIPNRTAFTANFGSIASAQDARQLQLALKLVFLIVPFTKEGLREAALSCTKASLSPHFLPWKNELAFTTRRLLRLGTADSLTPGISISSKRSCTSVAGTR